MELNEIRSEIDRINREMLTLFERRMELCGQVAAYKGAHGMPIFVPAREKAILEQVQEQAAPSLCSYDLSFFQNMLTLSREYQAAILGIDSNDPDAAPLWKSTRRLILRPLSREDLPPVYSLTSDPEVTRFLHFSAHTSPNQTIQLIDELNAPGSHAFLLTDFTQAFVGVFALKQDENDPSSANLTIFLEKSAWNHGYCGELLEFARENAPEMGFSTLRAWVADQNTPSKKALERAGFTLEQRLTLRDAEGGLNVYCLHLSKEG